MDEREQIREQNRWNPDKKEKEESEKPKSSLPKGTIVLMLVTAGIIDAVQAFLLLFAIGAVLNTFISIFMVFVFFLWFMMHGVSFVSPKRLMGMGGGFLVELIPVLDALPAWTAAVWYTISTTKILETVEKLPGGKIAGTVARSQISSVNTARATAIEEAKAGLSTQSANRGNVLYMGAKNPQQTGQRPQNIPGYQKNTPQKQPITLAGENDKWKKELAQLEPELLQKRQAYKEADQRGRETTKYLSEYGSIKGEAREKELLEAHDKGMAPYSKEITKISSRVSDLKQMIYSSNHKLSEQNRQNGTSKAA